MKLLYIAAFLSLAIIFSFSPVNAIFSDSDCFNYYEFQNGLVFNNLKAEKALYMAGDEAIISYDVVSTMKAPIVDGEVKMQIYYQTPTQELLVYEAFPQKEVYLFNGDLVSYEYKWKIPKDYNPGNYIVKTYFIVADKFNLGGINFLSTVPGQMTNFEVKNPSSINWIYFDKDSTSINDAPYIFTTFSPEYQPGTALAIKTKLINGGSFSHNVKVKMEIYRWDDLLETSRIDTLTKEVSIQLSAGQKSDITYDLNDLTSDSYLAVLTATDENGNVLSILKLRFSVTGEKGRFIYLGLDKFPLAPGKETTLFVCFSGAADYVSTFLGRIVAEVIDSNGKVIYSDEMKSETIASSPTGKITTFSPQSKYFKLTLRGTFYDAKGNAMDIVSVPYDYSKFASIPRTIKISASDASPGGTLSYTISYSDDFNNGLPGKAIVSLIDFNNKLVVSDTVSFEGNYKGSMKIPTDSAEGAYKISVIETQNNVKAEKQIQVSKFSFFAIMLAVFIILLLIIFGVVLYKRKMK